MEERFKNHESSDESINIFSINKFSTVNYMDKLVRYSLQSFK